MHFLCFRIFDRSDPNFKGIELKVLQIVGLIKGYNLCKFQIDSLQIIPDELFCVAKILTHFY